ncbi:LAGLIDADG family homing endonuclease [Caenispirillum bisanense]|uniref:LAGLIDADG family homing endonuclease n=1 Tax=Caenispirillum bisanense TaxID=414052 RepID=UPI0031D244A8
MLDPSGIAQQIWDMKYRQKTADGTPVDKTVADTWQRVATALAAGEADADLWRQRYAEAMADFVVLPAGRILAGAGTGRRVTLFNCFVMGRIDDDMGSIFAHLREAALTMQQGGGIGYDFSTLRPRGAPVRGVDSDASGPVSFMDVWDAMCRTIMSAGSRRGAMMATLRCDHPDIEDFVDAKRDPARLRMFNLSVLVTDAFMTAVREDADWPLVFGGRTWRTLRARDLWTRIMQATYDVAEPGVVFIDRINTLNPLSYAEEIIATNPCVTADTWVSTAAGPRMVGDLVGQPFTALVDGAAVASGPEGFFPTGVRAVVRLMTREGPALTLTPDHRLQLADGTWRAAGELEPGDRLRLHDHRPGAADWGGTGTAEEGYLLGLLIGDGTLKTDKAVLSVWVRPDQAAPAEGSGGIMAAALEAAHSLPHRADFAGWQSVSGRPERRLVLGAVRHLAHDYGMAPGRKTITAAMERASSAFQRGLLRGLFDSDGSVQGRQGKGVSIRLAQSDAGLLATVQRMLLRFGIVSTLYRDRRAAGTRLLPDGKGGRRAFACNADHELVVSGASLVRFAEQVGFADTAKRTRLQAALAAYCRAPNRPRFFATVAAVLPAGEAPVYDVRVPGPNAFDANGLVAHNCGEQPLPAYGTCLLGSVNLARLVERPFEAEAALDLERLEARVRVAVRMLDAVIDISNYPLPQQRTEAETKRRIGLGVTGLADALILCGARYGSAEAVRLTESWLARLRRAAYLASAELAAEKGPFPLFDRDRYLASPAAQALDADVREAIAAHGLRNGLLTSIAPTGTISLFADNVSSGLEPVFSFTYTRRVLMPDGSRREETVADYAWRLFRALKGETAPLPPAFVTAMDLAPRDHLVMQAAVQTYIDSGISKTINVPEDISFDAFQDVYRQAYDLGCKGCTTYRPNAVTGAVLEPVRDSTAAPATATGEPAATPAALAAETLTPPPARPAALPGYTYKLRWPESDHATYITVNDVVEHGRRRPFEVFINSKNMEHYAWTVALTRMISAVFRRGGDVGFVVEELKAVFDPRGGAWMEGRYVPSILAAIGEVIEAHMVRIGFLVVEDNARPAARRDGETPRLRSCPKCGQAALLRQEGCDTCTACGYSRCG